MKQATVDSVVTIKGIALHSGKQVVMNIKPLEDNQGIIFKRVDLPKHNKIKANYKNVSSTTLCTEISNKKGAKVATIEHLMAAFFFLGIDNALVEVDSTELPSSDGSAYNFIKQILKVGIKELSYPKNVLKILKPVVIKNDVWELSIKPSNSFIVNAQISFSHKLIGTQKYTYKYGEHYNANDIYKAKTFGFLKDAEKLHKAGIGLGANNKNSNILTDNSLMEGCELSYENEFVKHKILDLCGDLYLSDYFIQGEITANKPGHFSNNQLLKSIFSSKYNYCIISSNANDLVVSKNSKISSEELFSY